MKRSIITIAGISLLTFWPNRLRSRPPGSTYSRSEARQVQEVEFGTVLSTTSCCHRGQTIRGWTVTGSNHRWRCWLISGQGKGQEIFTILGAVGGAVVGSMIEEKATRSQGSSSRSKWTRKKHYRLFKKLILSMPSPKDNVSVKCRVCAGPRFTRIAVLMRTCKSGIQIENLDPVHAWDTPVGL